MSLCGSRTDANKDTQVGMTTLTTVVVQRLETSTGSSTFSIKCGDDGFHHDSLDVQYLLSTGHLHRAHTKVPHVSYTGDNFASMSSVLTKWFFGEMPNSRSCDEFSSTSRLSSSH